MAVEAVDGRAYRYGRRRPCRGAGQDLRGLDAVVVNRPPTGRIWFAQALRGVAALLVVIEHLTQDYIDAPKIVKLFAFVEPVKALPKPPFHQIPAFLVRYNVSTGIFAVGLFFLISGFVIPFSLERRTLGGFVIRRFFRLYPTLWCSMAITILTVVLISGHRGFPYSGSTVATNGGLMSGYAGRYYVDPAYWTLAIEEVFYICAAVIAWRGLLHRRTTLLALAAVLATMSLWIGNPRFPSAANPTSVDHFMLRLQLGFNSTFVIFILIGMVFHHHYRRMWGTIDSLAMGAGLVVLYYFCLHYGPFPGKQPDVFFTCSFAALLVFIPLYVLRDRIPYSKAADNLGEISYPLYLIHTVVGWVLLNAITKATGQFYVALPIALVVVVALAVVVHRFVEKPSMEFGRRIANRPRFRRDEASTPVPVEAARA